MALRTIFMGSPDFAVPVLAAILAAGHRVACVYAQPPRPAGRGQHQRPSPVHAFAQGQGLPVRTPRSLKDGDEQRVFAALAADVAVVAAYGLILPPPILAAPRLGCVNVHASLLPRWRGAAPIQRALAAGDSETGITIMQMDAGLDTGPLLSSARIPIDGAATAAGLHDTLAALGAELLVQALAALEAGTLVPTPQPASGVTYAHKLAPEESRIDWSRPASELERAVRALNPWPGVWFEHQGRRIKVLAAQVVPGSGLPGTVLDDRPAVACGERALVLTRLQREGKAPVDAAAFLRGYDLAVGAALDR